MTSLLRFLLVIWIWVSPQSSQITCEHYSEDLLSPLYGLVAGYSASTNSMYIMGGKDSEDIGQRAVYKWDLDPDASSEWLTPIATIPEAWWESAGVQTMFAVENILYVFGVGGAAHTVNKFDTVTNQWLENGAEPQMQFTGGCVAYNGTHFGMIDGWRDSASYDTQFVYIQFYDIARDEWSMHTVEAPFDPTGLPYIRWRYQFCAFVDDKLYIFGGKIGGVSGTYLDGMWRYDTVSQQFTSIGTLPRPCGYGTTAFDGFDHMYLVGCAYTNEIWVFDTSTESIMTDIIFGQYLVSETTAVIFNRSLWIFGGWTGVVTLADVQICDISSFLPAITTTTTILSEESLPRPSVMITSSALPSRSGNVERDLLLSIAIVSVASGCFCVALVYFLWSGNKRSAEPVEQRKGAKHMQHPVIQVIQLQHPSYPQVPPHYVAGVHGPRQPLPQVLHPQNDFPHQSPPTMFVAPVQPNIVQVVDDGNSEDQLELTAEGQADDDEQEQSKTRSSDSSVAMHDDHWAVYKVTNMNGVDDAHKLEIFDKDMQPMDLTPKAGYNHKVVHPKIACIK